MAGKVIQVWYGVLFDTADLQLLQMALKASFLRRIPAEFGQADWQLPRRENLTIIRMVSFVMDR